MLDIVHSVGGAETRLTEFRSELGQDSVGGDAKGGRRGQSRWRCDDRRRRSSSATWAYINFTFAADAETELAGRGELARRKTADSTPLMLMR